jgi:hypothetical protein
MTDRTRRSARRAAVLHHRRSHLRATVVERRGSLRAPPARRARKRPASLRAAPAAPRARARARPGGRPAQHHPAPTRARQPRYDVDLPARNRPRGDHRRRPRATRPDDVGQRRAATLSHRVARRERPALPPRPDESRRLRPDRDARARRPTRACPGHDTRRSPSWGRDTLRSLRSGGEPLVVPPTDVGISGLGYATAETIVYATIWPIASAARAIAPIAIRVPARLIGWRRARAARTMAAIASGSPIQRPPDGRAQAIVDPGTDSTARRRARPGRGRSEAMSMDGRIGVFSMVLPSRVDRSSSGRHTCGTPTATRPAFPTNSTDTTFGAGSPPCTSAEGSPPRSGAGNPAAPAERRAWSARSSPAGRRRAPRK